MRIVALTGMLVLAGCLERGPMERAELPGGPDLRNALSWNVTGYEGSLAFVVEVRDVGDRPCRLDLTRRFHGQPPVGPLIFAIAERNDRLALDMTQGYGHLAKARVADVSSDAAESALAELVYGAFGTPEGENRVGMMLNGPGRWRATVAAPHVGPTGSLSLAFACEAPLQNHAFRLWGASDVVAFQHDAFEEGLNAGLAATGHVGAARIVGGFAGERVELVAVPYQTLGTLWRPGGSSCDLGSVLVCRLPGTNGTNEFETRFAAARGGLHGIVGGFSPLEAFEEVVAQKK